MAELRYEAKQQTAQDIINRFSNDALNLDPGFQRNSVWSDADRRKLIESIVRGSPLPAVFLYKRHEDGQIKYDVIDGKQRLESILRFAGEVWGKRFSARLQLPGDENREEYDWKKLARLRKQTLVTGYEMQVIEVDGDIGDVVDLFVRINSTGKALTNAEKRHAKYYAKSDFFKAAAKLAEQLAPILVKHGILTETQISRMKHSELVSKLMVSVDRGEPINAKAALDAVMQANSLTVAQVRRAGSRTKSAIRRTLRLLPNIKSTRFRRTSDFYTLVLLMSQFQAQRLVLTGRKRNQQARELLTAFSVGVDKITEQRRRAETLDPESSLHRGYLLTVIQGTDKQNVRLNRKRILRLRIEPIFERTDEKRLFTAEQRRILWNTSDEKVCAEKSCRRKLGWEDFTADHINPWSKGGRTELENAAIYCWSCNASKGNRKRARLRLRRSRAA